MLRRMDLPQNPFILVLFILVVALALGTIYLSLKDIFYSLATGKPARERVNRKNQSLSVPMRVEQIRWRLAMLAITLVCLGVLLFSSSSVAWKVALLLWIARTILGAIALVRRWKRENSHSSEAAT
jgi:uncharacterized membrane protein YciS (DUF1049 family)